MLDKIYFKNFDGIRTLAFTVVFISHICLFNSYLLSNKYFLFLKSNILVNGYLGVNLFFTLSGFLITFFLLKEKQKTGEVNIKAFYLKRILRIWPLYFITLLLGISICYLVTHYHLYFPFRGCETEIEKIEYYFFFASNFALIDQENIIPVIGVLWSISIEEQFYLIWPLIIWFIPDKHLLKIFFAIVLASVIFRYYNYSNDKIIQYHTLSCMTYLTFGAISAYYFFQESSIVSFIKNEFKKKKYFIYAFSIVFLISRKFLSSYIYDYSIYRFYSSVESVVISFLFSFFILDQAIVSGTSFQLKNYKWLTSIGKYTYGAYCYHMIAIFIISGIFNFINIKEGFFVQFIMSFIIAYVFTLYLSKVSYEKIEKLFLEIKDKI